MRHFKLTIAYDGTDFHGWQMQGNKPTIQGEIVNVLQRLTQETLRIGKEPELPAAFGDTWRMIPNAFMLEAAGAIPKLR